MAVVPIATLKTYYEDGKEPNYNKYVDLIDTLSAAAGDMLKSVYDPNDDGIVAHADLADAAPWSGITGKPSTYSPSSHTHGGGDITSAVANANAVPWSGITGKPSTYTPSTHTHTGSQITSAVSDSNKLGGINAGSYLIQQSTSRPGVIKLYRADSDSGYYVRHYWTGSHWYLQGYNASDVYHAGCRVAYADNANTLDGIDSASFARSNANDTITGLWSINNDLRIRDGLYVGSVGTNPTNGNVQATADICAGGGIYAGNAAAAATNGYLEASSHVVANGNFFGRSSDHYFKTSVNIGYGSDVDSNRFKLLNESVNYRIEKAYAGTSILWFNWTGNGAGSRTTRCANGNGGYGNIHADNFVNESTRASKRNIRSYKKELPNSLDVVDRIEPVKFKKVNGGYKDQEKERIGFVAEDLAEVLPEVVAFDDNGHPEGIAYDQIVPLLVLSIQELRTELEELKRGR